MLFLQHSLTPRCLTIIENINFVYFSFSPQVDFPVDFTRQNPSRVDIKQQEKVLKKYGKVGNNAQ